jgi:hypothetical protein
MFSLEICLCIEKKVLKTREDKTTFHEHQRLYVHFILLGWDLATWLERLTFNVKVSTVLGLIPASSDTVESEGRQIKQC